VQHHNKEEKMRNNKVLSAFAGLLLAATSASSQAGIVDGWGAYTSTSSGNHCRNGCSGSELDVFEWTSAGGELSSYATTEENTYGESKALVDLSGTDYLPILKVMASASQSGMKAGASAFASQGFDYLGDESTNITLNLNLHGSVGGNSRHNSISAHVGILIGTSMPFYPDFGTAYYEAGMMGGARGVGTGYLNISRGTNINKQDNISFDLNPGESFYVITEMNASASDGFADAWNTLTMDFLDSKGLQAVSTPQPSSDIPEPPIFILTLSALAFLLRQQLSKQK